MQRAHSNINMTINSLDDDRPIVYLKDYAKNQA